METVIKRRFGRNVVIIYGGLFGLLIVGLLALLFFVAKFGFIDVPVFSRFYHPPRPDHVVRTQLTLTPEQFTGILGQRLNAAIAAATGPTVKIALTEEELTGALRGILSQQRVDVGQAQVDVVPGSLEIAGRLQRSIVHADVLIRSRVIARTHDLVVEPTDIHIGALPLSHDLALQALALLGVNPSGWQFSFGNVLLRSVALTRGRMEIEIGLPAQP